MSGPGTPQLDNGCQHRKLSTFLLTQLQHSFFSYHIQERLNGLATVASSPRQIQKDSFVTKNVPFPPVKQYLNGWKCSTGDRKEIQTWKYVQAFKIVFLCISLSRLRCTVCGDTAMPVFWYCDTRTLAFLRVIIRTRILTLLDITLHRGGITRPHR